MQLRNTRRPYYFGGAAVLIIGLALGLGIGLTRNNDSSSASTSSNNAADTGGAASNRTAVTAADITPFPAWNWTDSTKMNGIAIGNWLVLERWMHESWFTSVAGENAWDEWDFSSAPNATAALTDHWNTWITEQDVDNMAAQGFNFIRLPVGFWALIPTESPEPYITSGQLDQIERILGYAYKNKLYVLLDLHGMPGNQNGEQQSGQNTTNIQFFTEAQQTRSDATVKAALDYIDASPYKSLFAGLGIVNEPRPWTQDQLDVLHAFYDRSYATLSAAGMPMVFHHGFQGLNYWNGFIEGKDPSLLIMEDHPYPGFFPAQTNAEDILQQVCDKATGYQDFGIPVAVTEYSLSSGIDTADFEKQFFIQQKTAWDWSAGSTFWAWKTIPSDNPVLANSTTVGQFSYETLQAKGAVDTSSTTSNATPCGPLPNKQWASPVPSASSSPSTFQSQSRRKRERQFNH